MADITSFVLNNLWVCIGVGVLVVIIGDEILGVSRALLADPTEDLPFEHANRKKAAQNRELEDPFEENAADNPGLSVEDMLRKK